MEEDDDGVVIEFKAPSGARKPRQAQKPRASLSYTDEEKEELREARFAADKELLQLELDRIRADSQIAVGKAAIFADTTDKLAEANELTAWKGKG